MQLFFTYQKKYLLKGRRLTLSERTLCRLSIEFMFVFIIPRKLCLMLKKMRGDFLYKGVCEKKPCWVNWLIVSIDKKKGGLGVTIFNYS